MNPEEGDLRPQLLDRFALCVDIQSISDSAPAWKFGTHPQFERNPEQFYREWQPKETELAEKIIQARQTLPKWFTTGATCTPSRIDGRNEG